MIPSPGFTSTTNMDESNHLFTCQVALLPAGWGSAAVFLHMNTLQSQWYSEDLEHPLRADAARPQWIIFW